MGTPELEASLPILQRFAESEAFKKLLDETMRLVKDVAAYLDGRGREASKKLPSHTAAAYASESVRMTSQLMQTAAWVLLVRAVQENGLPFAQFDRKKRQTAITRMSVHGDLTVLPEEFRALILRTKSLAQRVLELDRSVAQPLSTGEYNRMVGAPAQLDLLRQAFEGKRR